jgi:hypothetical protein
LLLLYIIDLPKIINNKSLIILLADTSMLVSNPNPTDFQNDSNIVFARIHAWFKVNLLSVNFNETHFIQFTAKGTSI